MYRRIKGLNIPEIAAFVKSGKLLKDYAGTDAVHISNEELLTGKCDILIPAALENQITEEIAAKVQAKILIEAANGPTTVEADAVLEKRGIPVFPDILANAGGVVVSYFEWVQNLQELTWEEKDVNDTLKRVMVRAFNEVMEKSKKFSVNYRLAAYAVAVERICTAKKKRGIFP